MTNLNPTLPLSSSELQTLTEYQRRLAVRDSFLAWCREAGYEPAKHHRLIIAELEALVFNLFKALVRGREVPEESLRLMVLTPPGSAKSTYISKLFPPWFLAQCSKLRKMMEAVEKRYDDLGILACTHNGDLSIEFGGAARNLVGANEQLLGYSLAKDSRASDAWTCSNGGYYRAGTVGSGISGRRMHLGLVDDFCGKEEDATSKLINDKVWTWWENDFINRLQPIAARVIIANHRNEDDLVGRLLAKEASKWRIMRLRLLIETEEQAAEDPLQRSVGDYLWPEYFTREQVDERMANPRASGIQQQEPSPEKGNFFQAEWFQQYDKLPPIEECQFYVASDHAISERETADPSCFVPVAYHGNMIYVLSDVVWRRLGAKAAVQAMLDLARNRKPLYWWAERGHISKSIGPFLQDRMIEEHVFINMVEVTPVKDKVSRAQSIQGLMAMGLVRWPKCDWFSRARKEFLNFPNGKHDDFVDALAHLGMGINSMFGGNKPKPALTYVAPQGLHITMGELKQVESRRSRLKMLALAND
jgi:predicted phage terminase large subunit-like protein